MRALVVAALVLGGCIHAPDPGARADWPHPALADDLVRTDETFTGAAGVTLVAQEIRARAGEPRAVLVIEHGLSDHGDRYTEFARWLAGAGYVVAIADLRGHGRSSGERGAIQEIDEYVADLDTFVARVRARTPDRPLFVLGHGLGGAIVALWAIERQPDVAGIVLSAPMLTIEGTLDQIAFLRTLDAFFSSVPAFGFPERAFSSDPAVVAAMYRDPLIYPGSLAVHVGAVIADGIRRIWADADRLTAPVLAIHGTGDRIAAPSGSRDLIDRAGSPDRTLRLYDGFSHDLLHEPVKARVTHDVQMWMDARVAGPHPGVDVPPHRRLRGDKPARALGWDIAFGGGHHDQEVDGTRWTRSGEIYVGYTFGRSLGSHVAADVGFGSRGVALRRGLFHAGVARRIGGGELSAATGFGLVGSADAGSFVVPAHLALELPLGPTHLIARGTLSWSVDGTPVDDDVIAGAIHAHALVGLQLGRDLRYWAQVIEGRGLYVAATYDEIAGIRVFGLLVGFHIWAAN